MEKIHTAEYARHYCASHENPGEKYFRDYWNYLLINDLKTRDPRVESHLLDEGGGTCGIWKHLSFDNYTSVDVSEPMIAAAKNMHGGNAANKYFVHGDIFSPMLWPGAYTAIVSCVMGVYYRPRAAHFARLYELLAPGGMMFCAIDRPLKLRHILADPFADMIDRRARRYTRISQRRFLKLAEAAGFKLLTATDWQPAPGWTRRGFILTK